MSAEWTPQPGEPCMVKYSGPADSSGWVHLEGTLVPIPQSALHPLPKLPTDPYAALAEAVAWHETTFPENAR